MPEHITAFSLTRLEPAVTDIDGPSAGWRGVAEERVSQNPTVPSPDGTANTIFWISEQIGISRRTVSLETAARDNERAALA